MSVLLDTNIFLDVLLNRETWADESQAIIDWCDQRPGESWIAWHTLANLYDIGTKAVGRKSALRQVDAILEVFAVCPAHTESARFARRLGLSDFEDALQVASASEAGVDWIVTRNFKDFKGSPIPAILPREFLRRQGTG